MSVRRLSASILVVVALAACSDGERVATGGATTTSAPSADQRYEVDATVLESQDHGPQLCLGGVAESYPPQCGGPDIVGWDWAEVEGEESANGTTWGMFHVVGTYADGRFTLTEPPAAPQPPDESARESDFTSPCPVPAGGWTVVDPATATDVAQQAAAEHAAAEDDFAGLWVDQSINPALADGLDPGEEMQANDPTKLVLNVRFTGDLDRHERELRARWGGALCVSGADRTEADLLAIQAEVSEMDGALWSSTDVVGNRVELGVVVDDGLQARLDERYGEGAVVVVPALHPIR